MKITGLSNRPQYPNVSATGRFFSVANAAGCGKLRMGHEILQLVSGKPVIKPSNHSTFPLGTHVAGINGKAPRKGWAEELQE
jgi:hypothetical protein